MKKIYLSFLFASFTLFLQAQEVKQTVDHLKADRATPLQADDIAPMNRALTPGVPSALRFPIGEEKTFEPLSALQRTEVIRNGLVYSLTEEGTPYFIKGTPNDLDVSLNLEEQYKQYFDIVAKDLYIQNPTSEFIQKNSVEDAQGRTHTRFEQYYQGVKVYGSEVILHAKEGKVDLFNGRCYPTPTIGSIIPTISENAAKQAVQTELGASEEVVVTEGFEHLKAGETFTTELVVYHTNGRMDNERLAWHITYIPNLADRFEVFVDAQTGDILRHYNNVCRFHYEHNSNENTKHTNCKHSHNENTTANTALVGAETAVATDLLGVSRTINVYQHNGTYFMIDAARAEMFNSAQSSFPNEPVGVVLTIDGLNNNGQSDDFQMAHITDGDNSWNNPGGVSAHFNGGSAYEYFKNVHNRVSINGSGGNITSIINVQDNNGPMDNAFWNGAAIFYGNGNTAFQPLARGLDVAGHEMSHGVIQSTANLEYEGESGALNESYADIFGAMIDRDDWKIGEDVVNTSAFPSGALRNMANPNQGGNSLSDPGYQPAHTNEQYTGSQDNGGVHINSGIPNKAYQLFATAVGKEKAEKIYYHALVNYLVRSSKFVDCRASIEQSATDLYGNNEKVAAQNAFTAVGIGSGGGTGGGANSGNSQNDYEPNPGQDYILCTDVSKSQLYLFRGDGTEEANPFSTVPPISRPSVTDDGTAVVYISQDKRMQLITIDWDAGSYQQTTLNDDPIWRNVSVSKDGSRVAALTDDNDNRIYIYDFTLGAGQFFTLYNPTYTSGVNTGDVLYADELEWDFSGNWLMYDAYNKIQGTTGNDVKWWDIGFIRVFNHNAGQYSDGNIQKLFSGLPENVSIGNPTFSKNSDYIIAFDYIDQYQEEYSLRGANIESGNVGTIFNNGQLSYPNYSIDDTQIVFNAETSSNIDVLAFVPLASNKISSSGGNASVFVENGYWGIWFAQGSRALENENLAIAKNIQVIPNPFEQELRVSLDLLEGSKVRFELTDIAGRKIGVQQKLGQTGAQTFDLDFGNVPAGSYFLSIYAGGNVSTIKVVKL